jgi:hypothetical protein
MLYPSHYKEKYENIWVTMNDGRPRVIKATKYRLRSSNFNSAAATTFHQTLTRRGIDTDLVIHSLNATYRVDKPREQAGSKTGRPDLVLQTPGLGKGDQRIDPKTVNWAKLAQYAFAGKGSPEAAQVVLQLAVAWGLTTDPQQYANDGLGVDCNGFVGNYIWHVLRKNEWWKLGVANNELGPDTPIRNGFYDRYKSKLIKRWEDLDNNKMYIMMRTDAAGEVINQGAGDNIAHITITEPGGRIDRPTATSNPFKVTVVESTASSPSPGITKSPYNCTGKLTATAFKINREVMLQHKDIYFAIAAVT